MLLHRSRLKSNHRKRLIALTAILCLILTACSSAAGSGTTTQTNSATDSELELVGISRSDLPGMARICLYCDKGEDFEHDIEIIRERMAVFSGNKYAFAMVTPDGMEGSKVKQKDLGSGIEFYVSQDNFRDELPKEKVELLISRPVDLSMGNAEGSGSSCKIEEKVPLSRSDIEEVKVEEGCPEDINLFDYGIDSERFIYVKVTLTESFLKANPQVKSWDSPSFVHDADQDDAKFLEAAPAADGRSFYLFGFGDEDTGENSGMSRNHAEALAYVYTHDPISQSFYIMDIPGAEWEEPGSDSGEYQVSFDDFSVLTTVRTFRISQTACTDENWETAVQVIKDRLEALQIHYALGEVDGKSRTLVIRHEYKPGIESLMYYFVRKNQPFALNSMGESIRIKPGDAKATVVQEGDRYMLALDMSSHKKDTLNKLTSLSDDPEGERIFLTIGNADYQIAWTDCSEVIRDGQITMEINAFTGDKGFAQKDRYILDAAAAILNGSDLPYDDNGQELVPFDEADIADLNAKGQFCITYSSDSYFGYGAYGEELKNKAEQFSPLDSGMSDSNSNFIMEFAMPSEEDQALAITDSFCKILPVFKKDMFVFGVCCDWISADGSRIRVAGGGNYETPGKVSLNLWGYDGVTQEDLDELKDTMQNNKKLKDLICFDNIMVF